MTCSWDGKVSIYTRIKRQVWLIELKSDKRGVKRTKHDDLGPVCGLTCRCHWVTLQQSGGGNRRRWTLARVGEAKTTRARQGPGVPSSTRTLVDGSTAVQVLATASGVPTNSSSLFFCIAAKTSRTVASVKLEPLTALS